MNTTAKEIKAFFDLKNIVDSEMSLTEIIKKKKEV